MPRSIRRPVSGKPSREEPISGSSTRATYRKRGAAPPGKRAKALPRSGRTAKRLALSGKVIRYAVIGLGYISQVAALPAFANARPNSRLVALVSDNDEKLSKLGRLYGVEHLYKYDDIGQLFGSGTIDAVYIALPNSLHASYTLEAARAGIHVLVEKPLAVTAPECEQMIDAAAQAHVKLMVAYRLHFDAATLEIAELARSGKIGDLRYFSSTFSMQVAGGNIRLKRETAGGPLYDIGIYCINAARMIFAAEPLEVMATAATHDDPRFAEVPETVSVTMKFPRGLMAAFTCSLGAASRSSYEIVGTDGSIIVDPAYPYADGIRYELRVAGHSQTRQFRKTDQFAAELLYFSDCILQDREPEPSGEEGLIDVQIIEAINESILSGRWVALGLTQRQRRPTRDQAISRPAVRRPALIGASSPTRR
jgi:predicted dehydrogenase